MNPSCAEGSFVVSGVIGPSTRASANSPLARASMTTTLTRLITLFGFVLLSGCGATQGSPGETRKEADKHPIGGACGGDGDCANGLFCDKGDPGGMCQKKCGTTADCGAGAVCSDEKKCYRACTSDVDCRNDYACMRKAPE